ncbi:30S ribosomal protein S6 [Mycoplasmopsis bovirhinis]|uniref:30S ribosomal protein S6 n=1 Tax=Mycoplasmopsis bovirhinis TaxID=29553 RepID=UPI000C058280|nr:30S ribosomal protein S6 [Mycoplasmopsis bovirhinis]ATO30755.1 30S ribosomal protein S6 [Mycoplasmopsis bovirhinis]
MNKYEIMMIVDPKSDAALAFDLLKNVFGAGVKKSEKLENNRLAYKINKSAFGQYILANVEAEGSKIAEFTRRTNIIKEIWRILVINLDTEKGLDTKKEGKKQQRVVKHPRKRVYLKDSKEQKQEKTQPQESKEVKEPNKKSQEK